MDDERGAVAVSVASIMTRNIAFFPQKNDYPILGPIRRICKSDGRAASNIDDIEFRSGPAPGWVGPHPGTNQMRYSRDRVTYAKPSRPVVSIKN